MAKTNITTMAKTNKYTEAREQRPRSLTPQQQVWELTDDATQKILREVLRRLKKRDQEDLCYALIAYLRYGIRRPFESMFMEVLFECFIDLVEG